MRRWRPHGAVPPAARPASARTRARPRGGTPGPGPLAKQPAPLPSVARPAARAPPPRRSGSPPDRARRSPLPATRLPLRRAPAAARTACSGANASWNRRGLGPEERHQAVPGVTPGRLGERQIQQQRQTLGLGDGRDRWAALMRLDRQRAENPEVDHEWAAETAWIEEMTAWRQDGDGGKVLSLQGLHIRLF